MPGDSLLPQNSWILSGNIPKPQEDKFWSKHKNCYFESLSREETSKKHQLQATAALIKEHVPHGVFKT